MKEAPDPALLAAIQLSDRPSSASTAGSHFRWIKYK